VIAEALEEKGMRAMRTPSLAPASLRQPCVHSIRPASCRKREFTKERIAVVSPVCEKSDVFFGQGQCAKCDLAHWDNKV
jgi:hypothetical protein